MQIKTRRDLFVAAELLSENKITVEDIRLPDTIVETVKIDSEDWGHAEDFNYKAARYMLAVQSDVLGVYNSIFNDNITLKNIDKNGFLIVKFSIENGCIQFKTIFAKALLKKFLCMSDEEAENVLSGMTIKDKLVAGVIVAAIIGTPVAVSTYISNQNVASIIQSNTEVARILSENQKAPSYIVNNIYTGTVSVDEGKAFSIDELKNALPPKVEKEKIAPIIIHDSFSVLQYDLDKESVELSKEGILFRASTEWLSGPGRENLKNIVGAGIDNKSTVTTTFCLSCKVVAGKVKEALVQDVGREKASGAVSFIEGIGPAPQPEAQNQLSLFDK